MNKLHIYLIDQSTIHCADNAITLFLNKIPVAEYNRYNQMPVDGIASALSEALSVPIHKITINVKELAEIITGELPSSDDDAQESVDGYNDNDILDWFEKYHCC